MHHTHLALAGAALAIGACAHGGHHVVPAAHVTHARPSTSHSSKHLTPATVTRTKDADGDLIFHVDGVYYQAARVGKQWIVGSEDARLPACATEDSGPSCVWNAKTQGNHKGRSFFVAADGVIVMLD